MGCLKLAYYGENESVLRCVWRSGEQSKNRVKWYDYGARFYDPQIGRFTTQDRFAEKYYTLSNYHYGANSPACYIDINGDSLAIFRNGAYLRTIDNGMKENTGYNQTSTTNDKGQTVVTGGQSFEFNDPAVDFKGISNGVINKVEFVSDATVQEQIDRSGATSKENGIIYAKNESKTTGQMDYGYQGIVNNKDLNKNTFYVRDGIAYNVADYGNYLWGRGMAELGISADVARLGANYNNFTRGRRGYDSYSQYDFGPGTYGKPGLFDSPADQRAIVKGYLSSGSLLYNWPSFNHNMK